MVATRNHPKDFPEPPAPTESPSKRSTRASSAAATSTSTTTGQSSPTKTSDASSAARPTKSRNGTASTTVATRGSPSSLSPGEWAHTPSNLMLFWLAISLPLVVWDTGYVMLRPYSMPGGRLHSPIWTPYALYGTIDHTYGWQAYNERNGWTAAQGSLNALESIAYFVYLYLVYTYGEQEQTKGRGAPEKDLMGRLRSLSESRTVYGKMATYLVLLGFSTALITLAKTILYVLIEVCSSFQGIGHNDWFTIVFLWVFPNFPWIIFPTYMCYIFGSEILEGLDVAVSSGKKMR